MELPFDAPHLYLPDEVPAVASQEISRIEAGMPPETTEICYVKARLVTPRQSFVVDTLLHVHQKSVHAAREFYWLLLATIIVCVTTVVLLLFFFLHSFYRLLILRCFRAKSTRSPVAAPQVSPVPDSELEHVETGTRNIDPQGQVTSPPMHCRTHTAKPRHVVIVTSLPMSTRADSSRYLHTSRLAAQPKRLAQRHSSDALTFTIQNIK